MKSNQKLMLTALKNFPILLFVVLFVLISLLDPRFFTWKSFETILSNAAYIGIIAVGMTFVLLTGGIDLSVGATMYISGGIIAVLLDKSWAVLPAILVGVVVGTLWGMLNAFLISKVKIIPFMVTLGSMVAGRGLGLLITESRHISVPAGMRFGAERFFGLTIPVVIFLAVVIVAFVILRWTAFGRQIYALGNDLEAAKKAGLNTTRLTFAVYIISAFCATLAAVVSISQIGAVSSSFGEGDEFPAIAAAVLGGTSLFGGIGNVFPGTVIGMLLIKMIENGLTYLQVDIYLRDNFTSVVILLAVFIDAFRTNLIRKLERRNIRVEKALERIKGVTAPGGGR